jgi:hypothetical protein
VATGTIVMKSPYKYKSKKWVCQVFLKGNPPSRYHDSESDVHCAKRRGISKEDQWSR